MSISEHIWKPLLEKRSLVVFAFGGLTLLFGATGGSEDYGFHMDNIFLQSIVMLVGTAILAFGGILIWRESRSKPSPKNESPVSTSEVIHTQESESHPRAYVAPWIESINKAQRRVQILGINFLGSFHDTREHLIRLLDNGGEIRVLLLSTESDAFKQREILEGQPTDSGTMSRRLRAESNAALAARGKSTRKNKVLGK